MCAKVADANDFHRMNNSLLYIICHQFRNEWALSFYRWFLNERYGRINWATQFLNPSIIIFRHTYRVLILWTCGHLHNAVFVKAKGNILPPGLSYSLKRTSPWANLLHRLQCHSLRVMYQQWLSIFLSNYNTQAQLHFTTAFENPLPLMLRVYDF
jgi:hypothetical protein